MKSAFFGAFVCAVSLGFAASVHAQLKTPDAYGVWIRGDRYDMKEFPYRGTEIDVMWDKVQPSEDVFDWKDLDAQMAQAAKDGMYYCVGISVGPMAPAWVYEKGVPKVMTTGHVRSGPYPYYLDPKHVAFYHRLIQEFGHHVRSMPPELANRVMFVQVKTGSTGDEAPYKGKPEGHAISKEEWHDFRLAAFKQFKSAFQEGPGPVVPMLFNGIASWDDIELGKWVDANVKGGIGNKQGGIGQGYQLNDEVMHSADFLPHLIDPAPGVSEQFTRCEMDRTWEKGTVIRLNPAMGFYWTAMCALHSGLSVWNLTGSCREWCHDHNYWEFAYFFNKYAPQVHSATATGAFSVLREGLDASDTKKFPEEKFGKIGKREENRARYLAIAKAYAARGAKLDDSDSEEVFMGQGKQRVEQKGFNDVGWGIFPGNYERFLRQIDPDETSVGLWRVGGDITETTPAYSRFARSFDSAAGRDVMSFDLKDSLFGGKPLAGAYPVTVRVVYYDKGIGKWALRYDATNDKKKTAYVVTKTNTGTWKEKVVTLKDAYFGNRGERGADLMLANLDMEDDVFHLVEVTLDGKAGTK